MSDRGFEFSLKTLVAILILVVTAILLLLFFQGVFQATSENIGMVEEGIESNVEEAKTVASPTEEGGIGDWADPFKE